MMFSTTDTPGRRPGSARPAPRGGRFCNVFQKLDACAAMRLCQARRRPSGRALPGLRTLRRGLTDDQRTPLPLRHDPP